MPCDERQTEKYIKREVKVNTVLLSSRQRLVASINRRDEILFVLIRNRSGSIQLNLIDSQGKLDESLF